MGIIEAIEVIRNGGMVRRSRMPRQDGLGRGGGEHWLCGKPGTNEIWSIAVNSEGHFPHTPYALTTSDVLATDWRGGGKSTTWD